MELGDIMNIANAAKELNLSGDQAELIRKIVKEAAGNKTLIISELKKHGVNITEAQLESAMKLVEKL